MPRQSSHIRLLILETDQPHPSIHSSRGGYASILSRHFAAAAEVHDPPLTVECDMRFVVEDKGGEIPAVGEFEGYDGVLLTGSLYDAHQEGGWVEGLMERLEEVWLRYPLLHFSGVCFGHQLICRMLGSTVSPHPDGSWEIGHSAIALTPIGQDLFRTSEKSIHLHQMHQDRVDAPPEPGHRLLRKAGGETGHPAMRDPNPSDPASSQEQKGTEKKGIAQVHVWGSSDHTPVQGIYIPQRVFTTQAHLAFDEEMVKREIEMRVKSGSIKVNEDEQHGEEVKGAKEWADAEHDGEDVARALLRFYAYEDDGISWDEK